MTKILLATWFAFSPLVGHSETQAPAANTAVAFLMTYAIAVHSGAIELFGFGEFEALKNAIVGWFH